MLEGYLKLDTLRRSGCKRAFLAWALKENPNPTRVARTPKIDNESGQQYNARVQQAGFSKGTALKFRIGGGASLGLIGDVGPDGRKPRICSSASKVQE